MQTFSKPTVQCRSPEAESFKYHSWLPQRINVFHGIAAPEEDTLVGYGAIIIPQEVAYLRKYDAFKQYIDDEFEMPDRTVALLVRFLRVRYPAGPGKKNSHCLVMMKCERSKKTLRSFSGVHNER